MHLNKALGQQVLPETTNELFSRERAQFGFVSLCVFGAKRYLASGQLEDAIVADGNPEDVRCQILQGGQSITHRLTMHHPLLLPHLGRDIFKEIRWPQRVAEFSAKDARKGLDGQ